MKTDDFNELFVLEMTNNHLGKVERGLEIIRQHSRIARFNNIRAAIKLQFRDLDTFVHKDFIERTDIRYIRRIMESRLSVTDYKLLVKAIRNQNCIPLASPFDEKSVDLCVELDLPMIKVASADSNDWLLLEKVASTKKPVIVSLAGLSLKDTDDLVIFFENRSIPIALNHCIAAYPTEDIELELNQIDFLKYRYPGHVIGFSTHEHADWTASVMIAYAKGARIFERHIDIDSAGTTIAQYSSLPNQIDLWIRAFKKAKEMCGSPGTARKLPLKKETDYLDNYIRGVYAKHDLAVGQILQKSDIYLAYPLQQGQISCRELMLGEWGHTIVKACKKDKPIVIEAIESPYMNNVDLQQSIRSRGLKVDQ